MPGRSWRLALALCALPALGCAPVPEAPTELSDLIRYLYREGHELADDADTLDVGIEAEAFAVEVLRPIERHPPSDEGQRPRAVLQRLVGGSITLGPMPLVFDANGHGDG